MSKKITKKILKKVADKKKPEESRLHIIGIGASAGGLEALEKFIDFVEPNDKLAYIIVQHLDPHKTSMMDSILNRHTKLNVKIAEHNETVKPNTIYVNPTNSFVNIKKGIIKLTDLTDPSYLRFAIDHFFKSLADDQGANSSGIILSGSGSDGTLGIKAIKNIGGLVLAQNPDQAKYEFMPQSAINTGLVDFVLNVEEIFKTIVEYIEHPLLFERKIDATARGTEKDLNYQKLFKVIRDKTGSDFSNYKLSTIERRVARRIAANKLFKYSDYLKFLEKDPVEANTLLKEFLITVTNFFRDQKAFDLLESEVIPSIVKKASPEEPVRIWIPACATGEEAYSIAMLMLEAINKSKKRIILQIFATDLDEDSIEIARKGIYPDSISANISQKRLNRFFTKEPNTFKIKKEVRESIVFAVQNVITDPPFSKLDLICCRNLLIYMGSKLQDKILIMFHYVLNSGGFLMLGPAESLGQFQNLYNSVNTRWKIFRKIDTLNTDKNLYYEPDFVDLNKKEEYMRETKMPSKNYYKELAERLILESFSLPSVLVNQNFEIVYFHGNTEKYFTQPTGNASFNILKMARNFQIKSALNTSLNKIISNPEKIINKEIKLVHNETSYKVKLTFRAIKKTSGVSQLVLIVFNESPIQVVIGKKTKNSMQNKDTAELEAELQLHKESQQSLVEELEAANEELKSSNEELQSTNEELQSTNEELETSKEEVQSTNEELSTTNSELQNKIEELSRANDDINNLLASTEIETIFLDNKLRIKRFTPAMKKIYNLIHTDIDRPISDITSNINYPNIFEDAKKVLDTLVRSEKEIRTENGKWYNVRILPYRTTENLIEGLVITFIDITDIKKAEELQQFKVLVNDSNDAVILFELDGKIKLWNKGAELLYRFKKSEALTMNYTDLIPKNSKRVFKEIVSTLKDRDSIKQISTQRKDKTGKELDVDITATLLKDDDGKIIGISTTERNLSPTNKKLVEYEKKILKLESDLKKKR